MFKKILLPVDLADRHQRALDLVAELLGAGGGEAVLLHVVEVISGVSMDEEKDFYKRLEKKARKQLDQLGAGLEKRNISCRVEVLFGQRGPEVLGYATREGADLIILTSPRIDPKDPAAGWGSLSYKIGVLCPCPVLLVK